ncbi:MAG TPA: hypothetical protein VFQ42_21635 [Mycobacterium sp.]|jgi:hypothetical protein|nr:hypothetical protein [Mycobacterium sp.]
MGLASQLPSWVFRMGLSRGNPSTQAWWAAASVMLAQGSSSACACAGEKPREASVMLAAADAHIIAVFISFPFSDPLAAVSHFALKNH